MSNTFATMPQTEYNEKRKAALLRKYEVARDAYTSAVNAVYEAHAEDGDYNDSLIHLMTLAWAKEDKALTRYLLA
jgi:CTP synthase (UTP-ammonia lyase)